MKKDKTVFMQHLPAEFIENTVTLSRVKEVRDNLLRITPMPEEYSSLVMEILMGMLQELGVKVISDEDKPVKKEAKNE